MNKHPSRCPEEVGDGRRGELGLLPPARWNLGKNRDGQRRMERRKHTTEWKTEDRAEEIRNPEKEETPEESEGSSEATRRGEG